MKRSARALELHMLDRAWTRYVNGNGAGLDWGRCLLMKWLRACISSSLGLSLSLDIGLLLKLNEYLKRRKAERKREKTKAKTKWNQTKWNFCHGAIWRYKRCFSIESICRQKLFKFSNRHMCVQWVGQWWGRGGSQKKNHIESSAPSTTTSAAPSSSFAFSWACHRFSDMRHNCRWYCQQRHQVQWSAERSWRARSRKKYGSRNVNELHCECHCSVCLSDWVILFFQRI